MISGILGVKEFKFDIVCVIWPFLTFKSKMAANFNLRNTLAAEGRGDSVSKIGLLSFTSFTVSGPSKKLEK